MSDATAIPLDDDFSDFTDFGDPDDKGVTKKCCNMLLALALSSRKVRYISGVIALNVFGWLFALFIVSITITTNPMYGSQQCAISDESPTVEVAPNSIQQIATTTYTQCLHIGERVPDSDNPTPPAATNHDATWTFNLRDCVVERREELHVPEYHVIVMFPSCHNMRVGRVQLATLSNLTLADEFARQVPRIMPMWNLHQGWQDPATLTAMAPSVQEDLKAYYWVLGTCTSITALGSVLVACVIYNTTPAEDEHHHRGSSRHTRY